METQMIVQQVLLGEIVPSAINPRKSFNEGSIIELAESIREKGLLQPILVRQKGKQYEIVCGERRYRAAKMVQTACQSRNTIDAIVRELTDQDVLEAQLVENFQREDVHPMEEAVAIKAAVEGGKYSYEDVAAKVGKKISYIRQRMKLNDLTPAFQKLFYRNGISVSDVFKLCVLPATYQKEIFKEEIGNDDGKSRYTVRQWVLDQYKGNLTDACFSLTDASLDKKMGACSGCSFNSSVSMLFPELAALPRCTNIACFKRKSDVHFEREFRKVKDDSSILLVYSGNEPDAIKALKKEGIAVLELGYSNHDCRQIEEPVQLSFEEYANQNEDDEYSKEELRKSFAQESKGFEKKKADFDKKVVATTYKKAFVVYSQHGTSAGKYIYVELNQKPATKESRNAIKVGTPGIEDIDAEINRIREREKRNKELDAEKIWRQVNELKVDKSLFHEGSLTKVELTALAVALYEKIGYSSRKKIELFLNKTSPLSMAKESITINKVNKLCRFFIADVLGSVMGSHLAGGNQLALKTVIESYLPAKVKTIEEAQAAIAAKRGQNVEKRIAELQGTRKKLQAVNKETKKSSGNKQKQKA